MKLRHLGWLLLALIVLCAAAAGAIVAMNLRGEDPLPAQAEAFQSTPQLVERGRYLALAGNCAGCHTTRGGEPYAGGMPIETPFGTVYSSNLTPDDKAGIGSWSSAHFWRAMHNGRSKEGRLLYPAFPYPSFTQVTREDSDAIYAYLRSVPPSAVPNREHRLRFPYDTQAALAVWRALSFKPEPFVADAGKPAEWNRGAYLVNGLGHCIACHGSRNSLGATDTARGLVGGMLPGENWYAPALDAASEAGVAGWDTNEVVTLLKTGRTTHASVLGPMAEVVYRSTQHLSEADLRAMAVYLQALPQAPAAAPAPAGRRNDVVLQRGEKIYAQQCAWCHGERGEGVAGTFPPLAGNRVVNMRNASNLVQVVRRGGFLPATEGNPQPYGMPPFGHLLDDADIAAVLSYVRASWGNTGAEVTQREAMQR